MRSPDWLDVRQNEGVSMANYAINRGTRSQVSISPEALEPRVLRKGIFTKDVEDQAAIAKRLSHAVNDGFAGTIAMASQSA